MKVKDLVGKEFENVKEKKIPSSERLALVQRKDRSLVRQNELLKARESAIIEKLARKGLAFNGSDPRMDNPTRLYLGTHEQKGWYCDPTPELAPIRKFLHTLWARERYIKQQRAAIKRSMKGLRAAMKRKERQDRWR